MPTGRDCNLHPAAVMERPSAQRPCGRKDKHVEVEDHDGQGFLLIGTSDLSQVCRVLDKWYVDNIEDYRFFTHVPVEYRDAEPRRVVCGVWVSDAVDAKWHGADGGLLVWA